MKSRNQWKSPPSQTFTDRSLFFRQEVEQKTQSHKLWTHKINARKSTISLSLPHVKPQLQCHSSDHDSPRIHKSWRILMNPSNVVEGFVIIRHDLGDPGTSTNVLNCSKQSWRSYGLKWAWLIRRVIVTQSCTFVLPPHTHSWQFLVFG